MECSVRAYHANWQAEDTAGLMVCGGLNAHIGSYWLHEPDPIASWGALTKEILKYNLNDQVFQEQQP